MAAFDARAPIWPVIIAPFVGCVYYLAIKSAFSLSIISALGHTATTDINLSDIAAPHWGSHWVYRIATEVISTAFGTFVAAGLAHGREREAALAGSCMISFEAVARLAVLVFAWKFMGLDDSTAPEPWYQYAIDAAMIGAPPAIGAYVAEAAEDLRREAPKGFGGINRLHFLWFWFAAFWYALGLIAPMVRIYLVGQEQGIIRLFIVVLLNGIPAVAIALPAFYGLALLTGHHGNSMHPIGRNMVGILVLVFGFIVGAGVQYIWYWAFQKLYELIFG
jgi:hypothetical protein